MISQDHNKLSEKDWARNSRVTLSKPKGTSITFEAVFSDFTTTINTTHVWGEKQIDDSNCLIISWHKISMSVSYFGIDNFAAWQWLIDEHFYLRCSVGSVFRWALSTGHMLMTYTCCVDLWLWLIRWKPFDFHQATDDGNFNLWHSPSMYCLPEGLGKPHQVCLCIGEPNTNRTRLGLVRSATNLPMRSIAAGAMINFPRSCSLLSAVSSVAVSSVVSSVLLTGR